MPWGKKLPNCLHTRMYVCWVLGGKWTFYLLEKKLPWCAIEYWRMQNF